LKLYLLKRIVLLGPVLAGVTFLLFALMELVPGDAAEAMLGPYATSDNVQRLRSSMNLEAPFPERYLFWIQNLARLDLGEAYSIGRPVRDEVLERYSATLILAGAAFAVALVVGVVCGVCAAAWKDRTIGRLFSLVSILGISIPSFWLGLMFISLFSVALGWFPSGGIGAIQGKGGAGDLLAHLFLPAMALGIVSSSVIAQFIRSAMLEVLVSGYIRTARAKGVEGFQVLMSHAFRNVIPSILPLLGLQAGYVIGGAVYIETVFQWPGVGRMLVQAIQSRDILLVQGGVLILGTSYLIINLITDVLQHVLDPRLSK
jgi:peptide/nickel transport system permease protein